VINFRMTSISYTEARDQLASVWDKTVSTREPVVIDRRGHESVVLVPASEWQGLLETAHLLRSPANARRLLGALNRLEVGEGKNLTLETLAATTGAA
jgi:antitoxin YefM